MITPGIIFASSIILFAAYAVMVRVEHIHARRLVGTRLRNSLDIKITRVEEKWGNNWKHLSRYMLQLGWYYSIHSLLRTVLQVLVSVYTYIEHVFEKNRVRTKQLRKELKKHVAQSHLTHMAHHKEKTAMSNQEQTEMRARTLENDHK
jgi:hypothetical protein